MLTVSTSLRKQLSHWIFWFFVWNAILITLIGTSYLFAIPHYSDISFLNFYGKMTGISFAIFALIGQSALFTLMGGLLSYVLMHCIPKIRFSILFSMSVASLMVLAIVLDIFTYHFYRYHLFNLLASLFVSGAFFEVIRLSFLEWFILGALVIGILGLESGIAYWTWCFLKKNKRKSYGVLITAILTTCLLTSYGFYSVAYFISQHPEKMSMENQVDNHLILQEAAVIPYYVDIFSTISRDKISNIYSENPEYNSTLQYPIHPIISKSHEKSYNIVIIAIDTWRFDMMNAQVTPHIYRFSKHSLNFTNHYSGGNSTQPGIFSLFYSLPPTYWSAMLDQHQGPVFIQQLLKEHYQLGIFSSAELTFPSFDKTVFRDVPNLQINTPGDSSGERDTNITQAFNQFINQQNAQQPFFGFLFYDAVHGYCEMNNHYAQPFQPAVENCDRAILTNDTNPIPYKNRYKNAVLYDDSLIENVLSNLQSHGYLNNTIVIITGDHGEEFNDEHLDYWGHGSAFDPYQLRTPLIIYWPGKNAGVIQYPTNHYDIIPTLMKNALGVTSPIKDFSIGSSLFDEHFPAYWIIGGYEDYAILQPHQTTIIYPDDHCDVTSRSGNDLPNAKSDPTVMKKVLDDLNYYYSQ